MKRSSSRSVSVCIDRSPKRVTRLSTSSQRVALTSITSNETTAKIGPKRAKQVKPKRRASVVAEEELVETAEFSNEAFVKEESPTPTEDRWDVARVFNATKKAFRTSTDSEIVGREVEKKVLAEFFDSIIKDNVAKSIYISGCPGSGKSALVDIAVSHMDAHIIKINAMTVNTPHDLYILLANELSGKSNATQKNALAIMSSLALFSQDNHEHVVLILDEIDHLHTLDQNVLSILFELPKKPQSRLSLVGIANSINMIDDTLPRLEIHNLKPKLLNFEAYGVEEMVAIIKEKLRLVERSFVENSPLLHTKSAALPLFQNSAIDMCVKKIVGTGDIRKAFDIIKKAIGALESELFPHLTHTDTQHLKENTQHDHDAKKAASSSLLLLTSHLLCLDELPKVTLKHVIKASSFGFGNTQARKIQNLSVNQQLVLVTLILLGKASDKETTFAQLNTRYFGLFKEGDTYIPLVTRHEFKELVMVLHENGLIEVRKAKTEDARVVVMNVRIEDVNLAIKGVPVLKDILDHGALAE